MAQTVRRWHCVRVFQGTQGNVWLFPSLWGLETSIVWPFSYHLITSRCCICKMTQYLFREGHHHWSPPSLTSHEAANFYTFNVSTLHNSPISNVFTRTLIFNIFPNYYINAFVWTLFMGCAKIHWVQNIFIFTELKLFCFHCKCCGSTFSAGAWRGAGMAADVWQHCQCPHTRQLSPHCPAPVSVAHGHQQEPRGRGGGGRGQGRGRARPLLGAGLRGY